MYGLVNKSVEDLVISRFGERAWERIRLRAGVEEEVFISDQTYPDEMTYQLVGAASAELGLPAEAILTEFGRHWVQKTATSGYGAMLDAAGKTLREFLMNLPSLHARVKMIMPGLQPPRFEYSDVSDQSLHLHYYTDRPGLSAFLCGILYGLGERFATPVEIEHTAKRADGAPHDVFLVSWKIPAAQPEEPAFA